MLVILLITFIALKIKITRIVDDNNPEDEASMQTGMWLGIALFASTIVYVGCYLTIKSPIALTLVTQFLFHCIVKVGFLVYFIYKTPYLYNHILHTFQISGTRPVDNNF